VTPDTDLSFDPRDPRFPVPGSEVSWAVQVFTSVNGYGLDRSAARRGDGGVRARCAQLGQQRPGPGEVDVSVDRDGGATVWSVRVEHEEPVKAVKLLLFGLPADGWWAPNTGRELLGGRFQITYPGPWWCTPWVASGRTCLSVRDPLVRQKVLHVNQPPYASGPIVELVHRPSAGDRTTSCEVPPVRLRTGDPQSDLDEHLAFAESAHGLVPWERRSDVPDWLRETALVVTLHGQHWTGHVFNTFARMAEALRFVAQHIEPRRVLVQLPGWEGRFYRDYPRYAPGADLGGPSGFRALAEEAHSLGFKLMPVFGGNGANTARYPRWREAALRNDTDRYIELINRPDWDGDRVGEGDQVFCNPGEPGFRALLRESVSKVVREHAVDAALLDTAGYWTDDPRHPVLDGYRQLASDLRRRHPGLLLASEGWWDALSAVFPLSQHWLGADRDLRAPRALTRYARTTGHLAEGAPGPGSTGVHELGFLPRPPDVAIEGHIPVVGFVEDTLTEHADEVAAVCRWAAR
jgi:hypothetical protein